MTWMVGVLLDQAPKPSNVNVEHFATIRQVRPHRPQGPLSAPQFRHEQRATPGGLSPSAERGRRRHEFRISRRARSTSAGPAVTMGDDRIGLSCNGSLGTSRRSVAERIAAQIRAVLSRIRQGRVRTSTAPISRARTTSFSSSVVHRAMTGARWTQVRRRRAAWLDISGMSELTTTASGWALMLMAMPSSALEATST